MSPESAVTPPGRFSRRRLLTTGAAAGVGAAVLVGAEAAAENWRAEAATPDELAGTLTVPFYGEHQQGIAVVPQSFQNLIALQLAPEIGAPDLQRMLRLLTDDAARMSQGLYALADSEPEFASTPARLTVTIGFGPAVVRLARGDAAVPTWLGPLEAFSIDRLDEAWNDGDVLLQIASDDPVTLAHSTRMLLKDTRSFSTVKWVQHGFRPANGSQPPGTTMRNLLGQVDGTVNSTPDSGEFDTIVWRSDDWLAGGTTMVIRRTELLLDKWDRLDRSGREVSVGRTMSNGAPLTGENERDEPDFEARTPIGFPVIPEFAHIRRARPVDPVEKIFRRGYNYELGGAGSVVSDAGLIFTSFQADLERQYLPIQRRLAELDLLNEWTTPIGSAVFAIPPGTTEGGYIGETLFT